jgi:glutamate synthase (NADPH/NADH) small chain
MLGHASVIFNRDSKPGGLNEYGIAAYKTVDDFAQREVEYILSIGNIELKNGQALGTDFTLADLQEDFDAVFLGIGLGSVNSLQLEDDHLAGVEDAVDYIARLRQADDLTKLPVGRRVVVIGGGMTAIDIAVQSKRLGAEQVDIVYRRGPEQMGASEYEQEFALTNGVNIHTWYTPKRLKGEERITGIVFARTDVDENGQLVETEGTWSIDADVIFKAIGQALPEAMLGQQQQAPKHRQGKLLVDEGGLTSLPGVWAGGDCALGRDDLTVSAVEDGKQAAHSIDRWLRNSEVHNG